MQRTDKRKGSDDERERKKIINDWQCPNTLCVNSKGNFCFGTKSSCNKCGSPKPYCSIRTSNPPHLSVIESVDKALLLSNNIPSFDVTFSAEYVLVPVDTNSVSDSIALIVKLLHDAFIENSVDFLVTLEK